MNRYKAQIQLPHIGISGQEKIKAAKVMVVGIGGLGSAILPYLASAGIGHLTFVDGDVVSESNLSRQVIYRLQDVGRLKVEVAQEYMNRMNPEIQVDIFPKFLDLDWGRDIIGQYDIVVDCTDNFRSRYLVNDLTAMYNIPMVYAAVYQFEGQVSVFNYKNGPSYRCLFPETEGKNLSCFDSGIMGSTVALFAMYQANEIFKIILGIGEVLSGQLLIYDLLSNEQRKITFSNHDNK